jgi:hypothetical protein
VIEVVIIRCLLQGIRHDIIAGIVADSEINLLTDVAAENKSGARRNIVGKIQGVVHQAWCMRKLQASTEVDIALDFLDGKAKV